MPDDSAPHLQPIGSGRRVRAYRVPLPHAGIIPVNASNFEATEYAEDRSGLRGRLIGLKELLIGSSMSNARLIEERLSKKVALAIFSSDALSSTAYATQEILLILVLAGGGALNYSLPIALAITALLAIVVASYRQTVRAYPNGGGAYIVAHENIGPLAGLIAAAALLIDYVLTVAVSIAACVEAIVSAAPEMHAFAVPVAVSLTVLIALGNLRGIRESGTMFSIPTYGFIVILSTTIVVGIIKVLVGDHPNLLAAGTPTREIQATQALTLFLILRAFSAGCTALTGVEAISNGVSAFKPPESRNAATTMAAMGLFLGFLFVGTTLLSRHFGIVYQSGDKETVMSQVGSTVFGRNAIYYALQVFTAGILFLAANTSYNGFPMLSAILARDGYLPRLFHQRGNRLVFTYGIAALTGFAVLLLVTFDASTTRLIPLYALGVFLSFTLAQAGMVRRWFRVRDLGWRRSAVVNGVGAVATCIVFFIILVTKFGEGGWMVAILLPTIVAWLYRIGRYYGRLKRELNVPTAAVFDLKAHGSSSIPTLVPVEEVNLPTLVALGAACERSRVVTAVHVRFDGEAGDDLGKTWATQLPDVPLVIISSPYRTVAEPLSWYVHDRLKESPAGLTIILPIVMVRHWYQRPLVNQSLRRLRGLVPSRRIEFIEQPFVVG